MERREPGASPRNEAPLDVSTGFVGDVSTVSPQNDTTVAFPGILPSLCSRLVTWLRCRTCHASYFAADPPSPRACSDYTSGRLQPVALWDLHTKAAPPGMLRHYGHEVVRCVPPL
jgi:hypothetical protein